MRIKRHHLILQNEIKTKQVKSGLGQIMQNICSFVTRAQQKITGGNLNNTGKQFKHRQGLSQDTATTTRNNRAKSRSADAGRHKRKSHSPQELTQAGRKPVPLPPQKLTSTALKPPWKSLSVRQPIWGVFLFLFNSTPSTPFSLSVECYMNPYNHNRHRSLFTHRVSRSVSPKQVLGQDKPHWPFLSPQRSDQPSSSKYNSHPFTVHLQLTSSH